MYEYKLKSYVEPSVSYFDGMMEAGKAISAIAAVAAIIAASALATAARGSENPLER